MERRSSLSVTMARACQGRLKLPARESRRVDSVLEEEQELEREEEVELARLCDCDDDDEEEDDDDDDDDEVEDREEEVIVVVVVVVIGPNRLGEGNTLLDFCSSCCTEVEQRAKLSKDSTQYKHSIHLSNNNAGPSTEATSILYPTCNILPIHPSPRLALCASPPPQHPPLETSRSIPPHLLARLKLQHNFPQMVQIYDNNKGETTGLTNMGFTHRGGGLCLPAGPVARMGFRWRTFSAHFLIIRLKQMGGDSVTWFGDLVIRHNFRIFARRVKINMI